MSPAHPAAAASANPSACATTTAAAVASKRGGKKETRAGGPLIATFINENPVTFSSLAEAVATLTSILAPVAQRQNTPGQGKSKQARRRANKKAKKAGDKKEEEKGEEGRGKG